MAKTYQGTKLQDLGNLEVLDPSDKIVIVKPKDEGVMQLQEFFFYVQQNLDLSNYYTTTQANARFPEKSVVYTKAEADARFAFLDRVYSKVQSDTKYALKDDTYTKDESDGRYAGIDYTYTKSELYTKDETFRTFALKTEILPPVDLSPYSTTAKGDLRWAMKNETYSKIDSDGRFAPLNRSYDKSETDGRYAKAITTYTKEETDSKFIDVDEGYTRTFIQNNIYFKPELYTRLESDNRFALKNNVYTVSAINEQFASKSWVYSRGDAEATFAPITTTYTKTEVNSLLDSRINPVITNLATNYYNKDNADTKFATKALTYSRTESDGKYALIGNTLTETQLVEKYFDKTEIDAKFEAIDWTPYLTKTEAVSVYATKATTLTKTAIESTYYTKAQVDDAIAAAEQGLEAGSSERYVTYGYVEERYAPRDTVYTKLESDAKFATLNLTYSRTASDNRYFLKAEVTDAIADSKTATLNTVATNYLTKNDASATYITTADAVATLANKTSVYTKTEADTRYHVKGSSYLKAEADSRYLKVGLNTLPIVDNAATGDGALLTLSNTHATNLESGRIIWANADHSIGNLRISNTVTKEAYLALDLRPNFTTSPVRALTVTPTQIEHVKYGKLHDYFALSSNVYTKSIVDSLFNDIRSEYVKDSVVRSTYATIANLATTNTRLTTLEEEAATDRTYLTTNFYNKTQVYTKAEGDARYILENPLLTISGSAASSYDSGLVLSSDNDVDGYSAGITWLNSNTRTALLRVVGQSGTTDGNKMDLYLRSNSEAPSLTVAISTSGIWHNVYGDLHTYFAKASETYTKTESDGKLSTLANNVYTKAQSDAKFGLKSDLTAVTARVTTEEGKLTALTTNLSTNYHPKTATYSRTESDNRYHDKLGNTLTLTQAEGNTDFLNVVFANTGTTNKLGGLKWTKGTDVFTLTTTTDSNGEGTLEFSKMNSGTTNGIFTVDNEGFWHTTYGDFHTYFAKVSDTYTRTQTDNQITTHTSNRYTKVESDNRYYTKSVSDQRYTPTGYSYSKSESDGKYALETTLSSLAEVVSGKVEATWVSEYVYTKLAANELFELKGTGYSKSQSDSRYALKGDSYDKTESDGRYYTKTVSDGRYAYKADSYTKAESDDNYYTKTQSDTNYYTKTETNTRYAPKGDTYTKAETDSRYYGKADVYTKTESNTRHYSKTEANARYAYKADSYTKEESDGNYYTKTQSDANYYSKAESDANYDPKGTSYSKSASDSRYYTRTQSDGRYPLKADNYTKAESDANYYGKSDVYTKAETNSKFYDTTQANARYELKGTAYNKTESDNLYYEKSSVYTKSQSDSRYPLKSNVYDRSEYDLSKFYREVDSNNATVGPGWITVAEAPTSRYEGDIYVTDGDSSDHSFVKIHWMRSFLDSNFRVINIGGHGNRITGVRVLRASDATYGRKVLQVYVTASSNYTVSIHSTGSIANYSHLVAVKPVVQNSITDHVLEGNELTGLDATTISSDQSIKTGQEFYAQNDKRVYHEGYKPNWSDVEDKPLSNSYNSTSTVNIATSRAVKYAYDRADNTYTKAETDSKFYDTAQANARYAYKADSYTKSESDGRYYTQAQSDSNYYTKTEANSRYAYKADAYTKAQTDAKFYDTTQANGRFAYKTDSYTKSESDGRYYTKSTSDNKYVAQGTGINTGNNVIATAGLGTSNCDHMWHDDGANAWHFVSDGAEKATGNSTLRAGNLFLNGDIAARHIDASSTVTCKKFRVTGERYIAYKVIDVHPNSTDSNMEVIVPGVSTINIVSATVTRLSAASTNDAPSHLGFSQTFGTTGSFPGYFFIGGLGSVNLNDDAKIFIGTSASTLRNTVGAAGFLRIYITYLA